MNVFITGFGFIGSNAACKFVEEGHKVAAFDIHPQMVDYVEEFEDKMKLIQGDISNFEALDEAVRQEMPQAIVHTSVYPVQAGNPESRKVFKVNLEGTANMLEVARLHDLRVVYLSSAAIYGQLEGDGLVDELEPFGPAYPLREYDQTQSSGYCLSKRLSEEWVAFYRNLYGLQTVCLRLGLVYGRRLEIGRQINRAGTLLLRKALAGQPLRLPYGADTYCDFVYVKDVVDAIYKAVTMTDFTSPAFNVAYEQGYSMKDLAEVIMKLIPGSKIELGPGVWPSKGVTVPRGCISFPTSRHLDISLGKRELGYLPKYNLEDGFREYADWMKKNWHLYSPEVIPFPT